MAHAAVEAALTPFRAGIATLAGLALVLLLAGPVAPSLGAGAGAGIRLAPASTSVTGNVTGPSILATDSNGTYLVNATGGPAFAANATKIGNLTYYASLSAANLSGVAITPASGNLTGNASIATSLTTGPIAEIVTISVLISSVYEKQNSSINLTYVIHVVEPYTLTAELVNSAGSTVLSFPLQVYLDGSIVGTVTIPTLTPGETYNMTYHYATLGLSTGEHTFSISLANEHGLVRFANGQTTYSTSFYVASSPTSYTLWYVAGVIVFLGVLFIYATRVAARRRGALRK